MFEVPYMTWIIVLVFIMLDVFSGLAKAFATGSFSSTIARQGLYNKMGYILVMLLAQVISFSGDFVDLGVPSSDLALSSVAAFICFTEAFSVLENACVLSPELRNSAFGKLLDVNKQAEEEEE